MTSTLYRNRVIGFFMILTSAVLITIFVVSIILFTNRAVDIILTGILFFIMFVVNIIICEVFINTTTGCLRHCCISDKSQKLPLEKLRFLTDFHFFYIYICGRHYSIQYISLTSIPGLGLLLTTVWSKALPLTASCLSPLPGIESLPGYVGNLPVTAG